MSDHPKLAYGLTTFNRDDTVNPIQWFDTLKEAENAHEKAGFPNASIKVYGLSTCLTNIHYTPYGIAMGYHYFGIHPDYIEMATKYGITDNVILGKSQND